MDKLKGVCMEQLHFKVKSPANFVKLACTILFERSEKLIELGYVWREVFNETDGEQLFQNFMEELFPEGCTIGEKELIQITNKAIRFLETDISCLDIKANHDKTRFTYYVYFAPTHKVFECGFAQHEDTVIKILKDFFGKSIVDYDTEKLKRFIINSFEIRSDNTTVSSIAKDADFIQRSVYRESRN